MNKTKDKNRLMIVAHADDESIWAGEKLIREKGLWHILCVVTPDYMSKFRIPIFLDKVSEYFDATTEMFDFKDSGAYSKINGDIHSPINKIIEEKDWEVILTHGQSGEYGHPHHIQVHRTVKKIVDGTKKEKVLWFFNPTKKDFALNLSPEKEDIFKNTYDDESGLPEDHPRKWVHSWNTTLGWEEGFVKYK
jgi:LmbE family N-acetylglucosaminyl deacetylase